MYKEESKCIGVRECGVDYNHISNNAVEAQALGKSNGIDSMSSLQHESPILNISLDLFPFNVSQNNMIYEIRCKQLSFNTLEMCFLEFGAMIH